MQWADRIGRRVRLRDLHMLMAVARSGSMSKAAEQLAISHPVVSKTIADLETVLGVPLFDRSSRGVKPTMYGEALLKCGAVVFDEMRQGIRHVEFLADPTVGNLRFGCSEAMAAGFIPAVAERFRRQYPDVVLDIISADMTLKYRELRELDIELLVGRIPMPFVGEDLVVETLFEERLLVVVGTQSRWGRRRRVDLADLVEEAWVLPPPDTVPGMLAMELFRARGLRCPAPKTITFSIHLTCSLLATGTFVALLPESLLRFSGKRLSLTALPVPPQRSAVGIITVRNRRLSPLAERFIEYARQMAKTVGAKRRFT
jgi:DNA-binding transcriptional LysR family regulator